MLSRLSKAKAFSATAIARPKAKTTAVAEITIVSKTTIVAEATIVAKTTIVAEATIVAKTVASEFANARVITTLT